MIAGLLRFPGTTYPYVVPYAPTPASGGAQSRPRLGELLVQAGYITPPQLEGALREQSSWGGRLGQNLLAEGLIDEHALAATIARQLGLTVVDLEREPPPASAMRLLPLCVAERYGVLAIAVVAGRILVACVDPTSNDAMREVRRTTGLVPHACVATASQIDRAVRRHYYGETEPVAAPDPLLDVNRRAIARDRARSARGDQVAQRIDELMDLLRRDPDPGS
jgi:type IV pilus assembly protein PilB